jgi:hypothetical protein
VLVKHERRFAISDEDGGQTKGIASRQGQVMKVQTCKHEYRGGFAHHPREGSPSTLHPASGGKDR